MVCDELEESLEEESGEENGDWKKERTCPSDAMIRRSLEMVDRLEEDARKVRETASICSREATAKYA